MSSCTNCHGSDVRHYSSECPKNEVMTSQQGTELSKIVNGIYARGQLSGVDNKRPMVNDWIAALTSWKDKEVARELEAMLTAGAEWEELNEGTRYEVTKRLESLQSQNGGKSEHKPHKRNGED